MSTSLYLRETFGYACVANAWFPAWVNMASPRFALLLLPGTYFGFPNYAVAESAPSQLFDKTVVLTWTEHQLSKRPDTGEMQTGTVHSDFVIYVSTAGRLFSQFTRQGAGGRSNSSLQGPDGETTFTGTGAAGRSTRFEGSTLVSDNTMRSGGRRVLVTFDDGYRSCNLRVIYGREGGAPMLGRGMDGHMKYFISRQVTAPSCSIEPGNVFAGR